MNQVDKDAFDLTPAGWAKWTFENYELDGAQKQLVMMGLAVCTIARDEEEDIKSRMVAMGRFQAIISQLNLPKLEDVEDETTIPEPVVVIPATDPRKQLRVVS